MTPATHAPPDAAATRGGSLWDARPLGRIPLMLMSLVGAAFLVSDVVTLLGDGGAHRAGWLLDELGIAVASVGAVVLCWVRTTYAALASLIAMAASLAVQEYVYLLLLVPLMAGLAGATASRRFLASYLATACLWMALIMVTAPQDVAMLLLLAPLLFAAAAAGRSLGRAGEQRERDRASISALHDRQTRAVEAERRQIARDLHDIVAHDITIIAMQARAAARSRDPEVAARSLAVIGDASRDALRDLRVILRVLQAEATEPGVEGIGADNGAEAPGKAGLPASALDLRAGVQRMAQKLESLGHPTTTRLPDAPLELPKGHEATLYRILQEATTNIAKHAGQGSACSLRVRTDAEAVHLLVVNELAATSGAAPDEAGGTGILGMQDRVGAFGGGFGAGPEDGRWAVRVSLPIAGAPDPVVGTL